MAIDPLLPIRSPLAKQATGRGPVTLYREAKRGKIKLVTIGGRTFIRSSEAARYVEAEGRIFGRESEVA